jgi:hypothetical protein
MVLEWWSPLWDAAFVAVVAPFVTVALVRLGRADDVRRRAGGKLSCGR